MYYSLFIGCNKKIFFILFSFVLFSPLLFASDGKNKKNFNAGDMIMHHVVDAHEIHFLTLYEGSDKEKHISIPLPIILYTSDRKFEIFSSAKFHNHKHQYDRYVLHHEKIYIVDQSNSIQYDEENHPLNEKPIDLSITKTVAGIFVSVLLMFFIFLSISKAYTKRKQQTPKGLQSFIEPIILFVRDDIAKASIGARYEIFMPYLLSVFFFIWISNILGLIPFIGSFNITGNISVTMILAAFTFIITTLKGNLNYWKHIFATPGVPIWLLPLMIPIEIMGIFTKPIVLMLRLFANMVAGHIIILSFISLIFIFGMLYNLAGGLGAAIISLIFAMFMNLIELLVAFLQAYVFTLLSAIYFGSAVEENH